GHEFGVSRLRSRREYRLRFSDVRSFTYRPGRRFVDGKKTGLYLEVRFDAKPGAKSVRFRAAVEGGEGLEEFRDHAALALAVPILAELRDGRPVSWTVRY